MSSIPFHFHGHYSKTPSMCVGVFPGPSSGVVAGFFSTDTKSQNCPLNPQQNCHIEATAPVMLKEVPLLLCLNFTGLAIAHPRFVEPKGSLSNLIFVKRLWFLDFYYQTFLWNVFKPDRESCGLPGGTMFFSSFVRPYLIILVPSLNCIVRSHNEWCQTQIQQLEGRLIRQYTVLKCL